MTIARTRLLIADGCVTPLPSSNTWSRHGKMEREKKKKEEREEREVL
jgi:hypothetical protein